MTDQTKKDDKPQGSEKAKAEAVKDALKGDTPGNAVKPTGSAKESPRPDATGGANTQPKEPPLAAHEQKPIVTPPPSGAKPPDTGKEPEKPKPPPQSGAKPSEPVKEPAKPSVTTGPKEQPKGPSVPPSGVKPAEAAKQPVRSGGPPGGKEPPKGPGAPSSPAKAPEPKKPSAEPPKKRGCLGTAIWLVAIIVALGAGIYYTWPYWPEAVKKPLEAQVAGLIPEVQTPEAKAVLEDRLAKSEKELTALKSQVARDRQSEISDGI